ncbi:MAG: hypothetical protein JW712_02915 [Dehalococcoidales bacterium]|nr:hypothetical protein [Dehalococcoidales bacterium]
MSDAGNILPQAEIDALFKQATGRNLSAPPEVEAAKIVVAQETPKPPAEPVQKQQKEPVISRPAAPQPPSTDTAEIDRILDVLSSLTKRIESIERNISELSQENASTPDISNTVSTLSRKINNESVNIKKINEQLTKITKALKGTPGYNARDTFVCSNCGSHGYLAVPMKCSNCGTEGMWGWYPQRK